MDDNEYREIKQKWMEQHAEGYKKRVKEAYLEQGYEVTDKTLKELAAGTVSFVKLEDYEDFKDSETSGYSLIGGNLVSPNLRNNWEAWLPFMLDVVFENPFFRGISIPLKYLDEEFVTRSVMMPERVGVAIERREKEDLEDSDKKIALIGRFEDRVQNLGIFVRSNETSKLPVILSKLTNLKQLWLNIECDDDIGELLSKLPSNVERLYIRGRITELPKELFDLNIKHLYLGVEIDELPEKIVKMKNLEYLELSSMELNKIPRVIGDMQELTILIIESMNLTELPEEIVTIKNLRALSIQISSKQVIDFGFLRRLELKPNLFISINPACVINEPKDLDFDEQLQGFSKYRLEYKYRHLDI